MLSNICTTYDNKVRELGNSGQKPRYGLMALAYQRFTAILLLIYGSLFLSAGYYCLSEFWRGVDNTWTMHLPTRDCL
jgi:succinate dehydrogenase hydrophobic anchor subunit